MKLSLFPTKSIGIGNVSVTFSTANIGCPAVIFPIIGTFTISRENDVTRMTYKVLFRDIGVSADEVFGITLVEGWLTGDNGSNEYGGCLYADKDKSYVVADAANTAGYIRIRADGSIAIEDSNAAVTASTETTE